MEETNNTFLEKLLNDSSFKNWVYKTNKNDVVFWNHWIKNNPEEITTIYTAKSIVLGVSFNKTKVDEDLINNKLKDVLDKIQPSKHSNFKKNKTTSKIRKIQFLVATVAAVGILFVAINFFTDQHISYKTGFGETLDLKLADGTLVTLNGNSEISYEKDFPRAVHLKGEAYFKVKSLPATKAKFWVQTENLKVEVYGTHFNVSARDKKTDVLLDEGAIKLVLKGGERKQMIPGELVSFSEKQVIHQKINETLKYATWKNDTYIFNNMPLVEVLEYIENTYGFPFEFKNPASKSLLISGGIPNENLTICLSAIQKSVGVDIQITDDKLIIN
ncbi:MAG: FecR family protein [Cellulophaga sp.]|nr:FecR family protein [Cellulophaga sp.]